jgi:6-phosphogluconolactonase
MQIFGRMCHRSVLAGFGLLLAGCGALFGQVNLYVPNNVNVPPNVSEYTINTSNGALTPVVGQASTTTDNNPTRVAMTPSSKFLYITNGNNQVDAYTVSPTGFLTTIQAQPGYPVPSPLGLVANDSYLYVASGTGQIYVFSINPATGALTPLVCAACSTGAGSAPKNVVLSGGYLYVALYGTNAIGVGTISPSGPNAGTLTSFVNGYTGPSSGPTAFSPTDLAITGNNLYASNWLGPTFAGTNYITRFTVSGATVTLGGNVTAGGNPNGLAIDPTGTFLFVANAGTANVSAFTIGGGGVLTPAPGSPFAAGNGPFGASVEPTGNFLYVSNQTDGTVTSYRITTSGASAGALTFVNTQATGTAPLYLLAHLAPTSPGSAVPAASTWSLAVLGILLAGMAGLLYRKAYR